MPSDGERLEAGEYVARIDHFEFPNDSFQQPKQAQRIWKYMILVIRGQEVRTPLYYECGETDVTGRLIAMFPEVETEHEMCGKNIRVRISKSGYVSDVFPDLRTPTIEEQRKRRETTKQRRASRSDADMKKRGEWLRKKCLSVLEEEDWF